MVDRKLVSKMDVGWALPTIEQQSKPYVVGDAHPTNVAKGVFVMASKITAG